MASYWSGTAKLLEQLGFIDVILPFMLVFTVLFAILQNTKVLGTENEKPKANLNATVAFIVALIFIVSFSRVITLGGILQNIALIVIAFLSLVIILGMFGTKMTESQWPLWAAFIATVLVFGGAYGFDEYINLKEIFRYLSTNLLIIVGIFALIVWFVTRGKGTETTEEKKTGKAAAPGTIEKKLTKAKELATGPDRDIWRE